MSNDIDSFCSIHNHSWISWSLAVVGSSHALQWLPLSRLLWGFYSNFQYSQKVLRGDVFDELLAKNQYRWKYHFWKMDQNWLKRFGRDWGKVHKKSKQSKILNLEFQIRIARWIFCWPWFSCEMFLAVLFKPEWHILDHISYSPVFLFFNDHHICRILITGYTCCTACSFRETL